MQQPRAVIALPNNIEIDARAQRNALALVAAGYDVTMVGYGTGIPETGSIAGVPYILCPPPAAKAAAAKKPTILYRVVRKAFHLTMKRRPPMRVATAVARVEEAAASVVRMAKKKVVLPAKGAVGKLRSAQQEPAAAAQFNWRTALPHVPIMIDAMRDAVAALDPDVIVTDVHLLPLGAEIAAVQAAKGKQMGLVYDAREFVYGLASEDSNITKGFPALESEFMGKVDATVTVCEPIAEFLARQYRLPEVPPLVPNAPIAGLPDTGRQLTVRDLVQVGDAPLLVYAGGLSYHRGVHDVISALPDLDGVHLAIGARRGSSYTAELEAQAKRLGVRDRVHFVPFAPTHEVAEYLASATAAIIPFLPVGNHNWAAPNKYFESVQARLPILTSDMEWLSERITTLGIGEVFEHSNPASIVTTTRKLLGNLDAYRAKLTDEVVAEHTFEHVEQVIQDVTLAVTDPALKLGLEPQDLTANLAAIRRDMMRQRSVLADADLFDRRPWLRISRQNTGGQAMLWCDALMRRHPRVVAESLWRFAEQHINFPVDETVTYQTWVSPAWQKKLSNKIENRVSHVLSKSGYAVVGSRFGSFFDDEIDYFRSIGVKQGLIFHGSDIRNPQRHAALEPDSPLPRPRGGTDRRAAEADRRHAGTPRPVRRPRLRHHQRPVRLRPRRRGCLWSSTSTSAHRFHAIGPR